MEDPDWMNDFKTPTEDVLLLSSSSPSSSTSRDVKRKRKTEAFYDEGQPGTNGKGESDDEDSLLITGFVRAPAKSGKTSSSGRGSWDGSSQKGEEEGSQAKEDGQDDESDAEKDRVVFTSRRQRGTKRVLEVSDQEEEEKTPSKKGRKPRPQRGTKRVLEVSDQEEEEKTPSKKGRKTTPRAKKVDKGRKSSSRNKGKKRVLFSEEEEEEDMDEVEREIPLGDDPVAKEDDEENVPLSVFVKKPTASLSLAEGSSREEDETGVAAVKKEPTGARALMSLKGGEDDPAEGDDLKEEGVHVGEGGENSDQKFRPRATSSLPVIFAEKVHRTKVLLECEGDALDLSGDMGAVGRFSVTSGKKKDDDELRLDLKGVIYRTTIVPSNTFFVVNVGQAEAKVEAIMNDFMQLRPDINQFEDETVVEGTLEGFAFDLDNEGEPLSTPVTASGQVDSDADDGAKQTTKASPKAQTQRKTAAGKGGKGSKSKGTGKGSTGKKPRAKAKATAKKPPKAKPSIAKGARGKKS